jgi:suppressor of ftsI
LAVGAAQLLMAAGPLDKPDRDAPLPNLPQVTGKGPRVALTLRAELESAGKRGFNYDGRFVPPTIRVVPGGELRVTYVNDLPVRSKERCALGPCMDMTNLHFHGMEVSPQFGQDDVLGMIAMPGRTLHYDVRVPADAPPGLYWYHTHPHGESEREALDGMSGAIVVEGIDRYVPEVRRLPERVLVLRTSELKQYGADARRLMRHVDMGQARCGTQDESVEQIFSLNGAFRPSIAIAPHQRQFWRIVNGSADRYTDLEVDGEPLKIIALDGMPLAYHDPQRPYEVVDHVRIPPGGRVEAIVTGPPTGTHAALRMRCVDTGADGDPTPSQVLADLVPPAAGTPPPPAVPIQAQPPVYKPVRQPGLERSAPSFVVRFTEHDHGFFINNRKFAMNAPAMTTVRVGTYVHWRIVNDTNESHPFHIHQVHFLAYAENGARVAQPVWLDTVDVPWKSTVDVILDATNLVIRGMSVFHCHILSHEDKGMMAKVLFR